MKLEPPERFTPLVVYTDTVATCDTMRVLGPMREGEHGFRLHFGNDPAMSRTVVAVWDTAGRLRTYSDTRGDMRGPPTPVAQRGPQTSIAIRFDSLMVLAINREHNTDRGLLLIPELALRSERVGSPLAMLARLHRQCGAPAYEDTPSR